MTLVANRVPNQAPICRSSGPASSSSPSPPPSAASTFQDTPSHSRTGGTGRAQEDGHWSSGYRPCSTAAALLAGLLGTTLRSTALLDVLGHQEERLLDVCGVLRRRFDKRDLQAFGERLSLFVGNSSLVHQVALIADKQLLYLTTREGVDLLEPFGDVVKRFLVRDIVHDDDAVGATIVATGDSTETLLACRVPNLKFDFDSPDVHGLDFEIDTNRGDETVCENVVGEPKQQAGLANTRVTDDQQFKQEVVLPSLLGPARLHGDAATRVIFGPAAPHLHLDLVALPTHVPLLQPTLPASRVAAPSSSLSPAPPNVSCPQPKQTIIKTSATKKKRVTTLYDDDAVGATIVATGDSTETLLACRVPLQRPEKKRNSG
eukprot:CAMPEP_0119155276 /NCGR_PEP_ID=MMETSP1310-20130426/51661_1 /TAXON_ID=464262 /ORGANISM="Genus nov. species nov., Strain RCC2339" /LENGTH=374 /DNA_ID=CAMNT_0007147867 /DNA_START=98 /DNA_END=1222 /DNA_ORIENTATION=+